MKRRNAMLASCAVCLGSLSAPVRAQARSGKKTYRVVVVAYPTPESAATVMRPLLLGQLKALGYFDGENLDFEIRSLFGADNDRQDAIIAEVVRSRPDVILADGTTAALRLVKATGTIPIVLWASVDPVGAGLAESLARPGKNVTGLATDVGADAEEKRVDILLDMVPNARRIAFVGTRASWENAWGAAMRRGAARRNVSVIYAEGTPANRFSDAVETVKREKPDAIFATTAPATYALRTVFGKLTRELRVPTSCGTTEMANENCVMAYGQSATDFVVRSLSYVDRILRGASPAELPIEQPTKFQLVLNLKLAQEIGLKIPQSVLLRADRVIE